MTARNMRKNVQINVGSPKNNREGLNLPNLLPADSFEHSRTTTGHKVPKIGIQVEALGLTPTALKKGGSRDGRRASLIGKE